MCTFAIGPYCNHFFMKQLAALGRGVFDVAYRPHAVQAQMAYMLSAAARPVLVDISLDLPGRGRMAAGGWRLAAGLCLLAASVMASADVPELS